MSSLQDIAAQLMAISGTVPVGQAEQVRGLAEQLHVAQAESAGQVLALLGDQSAVNARLQQNSEDVHGAIRQLEESAGNVVAMFAGFKESLADAASEVINR
ncbi:hypothetical protein [Amycolatopsis rubida]|uniref:Uncharacterized protein n=1 Tax=Amycolatopsis rubida TaxID=112413 RepID=A0A1I5IKL3_9PSEU|nr:hypothetical protein [Amycolatopsis rubida]SFO60716.1 hypothetical protein SAMN05421854_102510 [Amycolatopsis rubida]